MKILSEMMASEPSRAEDFAGVSFLLLLSYQDIYIRQQMPMYLIILAGRLAQPTSSVRAKAIRSRLRFEGSTLNEQ
jgi:hypothetical protein